MESESDGLQTWGQTTQERVENGWQRFIVLDVEIMRAFELARRSPSRTSLA